MTLQDWFKTEKLRMLDLGWVDRSTELCYFAFVTNALMCIWNNSYVRTAEMKSNEETSSQLWTQFMQLRKNIPQIK